MGAMLQVKGSSIEGSSDEVRQSFAQAGSVRAYMNRYLGVSCGERAFVRKCCPFEEVVEWLCSCTERSALSPRYGSPVSHTVVL